MHPPLLLILAALVGLAMGSFGNVLLHRIHAGESFAGRSKCPSCATLLRAIDLIPILSYALLRGRCRACRHPISLRYPLVEAGSLTVFLFAFALRTGDPLDGFLTAFILYFLFLACVYDALYQELPDLFTWWVGGLAVLRLVLLHGDMLSALEGAAVGAAVFGLQWIFSRGKAVGSGDIFLALTLGIFLGLKDTASMIVLAYIAGAVVILLLLALKKIRMDRGTNIAFGPFLGVGTLLTLLGVGDAYLSLF